GASKRAALTLSENAVFAFAGSSRLSLNCWVLDGERRVKLYRRHIEGRAICAMLFSDLTTRRANLLTLSALCMNCTGWLRAQGVGPASLMDFELLAKQVISPM